ncbi:MAG: deoxyribodipyrimidine photo-lyase [Pseudomonadota bacterium]
MADAIPPQTPTVLWLRRDLRLADHPGWIKALESGGPVVPVFILDPVIEDTYGAAPKWRLGESLRMLASDLKARGSRLILRRGSANKVLQDLIAETGARRVVWSRVYDPEGIARDKAIKAELTAQGVEAHSVNSSLLFEPWTVETKTGGLYRVYTPFWKAVRDVPVRSLIPEPGDLRAPETWPTSDALDDWGLGDAMRRGAAVVARHAHVGETKAKARLDAFIATRIARYKSERDFPSRHAVSGLSENLTYGEISPHQLWHAGWHAMETLSGAGLEAEHFLKEVAWREFAYHLMYHTPHITSGNWRTEWDAFPWSDDNDDAEAWRRGMTGIEMVDAAMREMYVTGTMHNRTRMLVASFLTKHLMTHWQVGEAWFRDCLIDWDPAANAMGWQWTAGSGPDAAPYFRVYNPDTQAEKFDPDHGYRDRFLAEGRSNPHEDALAFFEAAPLSWGLSVSQPYPNPIIGLAEGRERALSAYSNRVAA